MALIELFIAETLVSGGVLAGVKRSQKRSAIRDSLMVWDVEKSTPIVDGFASRLAGQPENATAEKIADNVVACLRDVVSRRVFRECVQGLVRPNSKIREWIDKVRGG